MIFAALAVSIHAGDQSDSRYLSVEAGLMVFDRQEAADKLALWAEEHEGYFVWKSDESVSFRVPDKAVEELRGYLEGLGDGLLSYDRMSFDLREEMVHCRSALSASEEILNKNLAMLDSSNVEGTLALEREIRRLMRKIDQNRGRLNKLEYDAKMAMVNVYLSFNQQTVAQDRPSRFEWINTVDFYKFINTRSYGRKRCFPPNPIPVPNGFARIDNSEDFNVLSPEGVRLQVREVDNYPQQDVDFWIKTLNSDLENRGYLPVDFPETFDWGGDGVFHTLMWALPLGTEDYLYLIGIRVEGKTIYVLEMAGNAEYVSKYVD